MAVYELDGVVPEIADSAWVADSAQVIGRVTLEAQASLWFGVVARGDSDHLHIGAGSNIQDNTVLHADAGQPLRIGRNVTVGHKAMLHGCTIGDESLIGIGAVGSMGPKLASTAWLVRGPWSRRAKNFLTAA